MIKEKGEAGGTVEEVRGTVEANKQFLEKEIQISRVLYWTALGL
jgi:hypothetical protein